MQSQLEHLLSLNPGARFLKCDLHVHTPASRDIDPAWANATPENLVSLAIGAGLDVIAVTDHNSAAWCDRAKLAACVDVLSDLPYADCVEEALLTIDVRGDRDTAELVDSATYRFDVS